MSLGAKVRELRLDIGWTQQKLADKAGITASYVSRLERDGFKSPSADFLLRLAGALKVDVNELYKAAGYIGERIRILADGSRPLEAILREAQEHYESLEAIEVPIWGKVPVSYPPEKSSNGYIFIPKESLSMVKGKVFGYYYTGDSLVQDGILPGDYIIADPEAPFIDSRIYIVRVENRVLVVHVYLAEGNRLRLISSSGEYEERDMAQVEIWGRVVLASQWRSTRNERAGDRVIKEGIKRA